MDYVRLGSTGLKVSRICLGMMSYGIQAERAWDLAEDAAEPLVRGPSRRGHLLRHRRHVLRRRERGVTGRLLGKLFARRDDYVLATKVFFPMGTGPNDRGLSRKHIMAAIDASLRRLGTDYVDLYQIHRWDDQTPIEETMEALHEVVRAGKARYIGASSMAAWQFAKAQHTADVHGWTRFVVHAEPLQPGLPRGGAGDDPALPRPGRRRPPVEPAGPRPARRRRSREGERPRPAPERPAARALQRPRRLDVVDAAEVAAARGSPGADRAGLAPEPPRRDRPDLRRHQAEHIDDAVAAGLTLTEEEMRRLEAPYLPHPVLGHKESAPVSCGRRDGSLAGRGVAGTGSGGTGSGGTGSGGTGEWRDGEWRDGEWRDGEWRDGEWRDGGSVRGWLIARCAGCRSGRWRLTMTVIARPRRRRRWTG